MTTLNTTSLTRKITLTLGAIVVSTMAVASANQAQAGVKVYLGFGGWGGPYYGGYYGPGWGGPNCWWYWKMYKKTGKWKYKKKFKLCKAMNW